MRSTLVTLFISTVLAQGCIQECENSTDTSLFCATDGSTIVGRCYLEYYQCVDKHLQVLLDDACPTSLPSCSIESCLDGDQPICGSDGKTYSNNCSLANMACANPSSMHLRFERDGECPDACSLGCDQVPAPVCGSDGQTYVNLCRFNEAACRKPTLRLKWTGLCANQPCRTACSNYYNPICGSNNVSYSNLCHLDNDACLDDTLHVEYRGKCRL